MAKKQTTSKTVEVLKHEEATRKNIPTAEYQSVMQKNEQDPVRVAYERRNRDLDPQLVWRGKDEKDWSDLVVHAPPLYIQEKVHPKVLIDDLVRRTQVDAKAAAPQFDLFADFNGMPKGVDKTEFYQHDQNWSNRMILGDSLQVMASLAEREGLRGKVQCIYLDPPYGIKFNSNFQWSTTSRDVKDGNTGHITREPEQVKAFRDTWRDGIHSYLTYLRDRLTVARDLLTDSGSIFVQIGDENVHRVRALMDEVFGDKNFVQQIIFRTTAPLGSDELSAPVDYILWFAKDKGAMKYRPLLEEKDKGKGTNYMWTGTFEQQRRLTAEEVEEGAKLPADIFYPSDFASSGYTATCFFDFELLGHTIRSGKKSWRTNPTGTERLKKASRLMSIGLKYRPCFIQYHRDNPTQPLKNTWLDTRSAMDKIYVVQTQDEVVKRCLLMASDVGDLALDPTCGSGTTVYVAEQWGRRWITIDTSRVALALARARIMGARYPYYLLADSRDGQIKEGEITRTVPSSQPTRGDLRRGFVYERVSHIQLVNIANNVEIDVIWEKWQVKLEPLRESLNAELGRGTPSPQPSPARGEGVKAWQEWEIPREAEAKWQDAAKRLHADWWQARIARQKENDASIAAKAEFEYLYDKPYDDKKKVRVAGPFTVESLSPHRVLGVDENDELIDRVAEPGAGYGEKQTFPQMILENLKTAGVQQAHKEDKITFTALTPWPGYFICAEGHYLETHPSPQPSPQRGEGEK
ncbi:MAG: site-specific DNA-methyltransferase, partial [bacterium]